jgi:hypothetical protein
MWDDMVAYSEVDWHEDERCRRSADAEEVKRSLEEV